MPRPVPENCDEALPDCQNCFKSGRTCVRSREPPIKYIIHTINPELQKCLFNAQQNATDGRSISEQDLNKVRLSVSRSPAVALEDLPIVTLFRHYIDVLAPWYDLNDAQNMFGTIVPVRAILPGNAILFKALIAFSACHMNRTAQDLAQLGSVYHASCVEELLAALNDVSLDHHEDYLAATCLLRSYEILNGDMRRHQNHLLGAYSFATNRPIDLTIRGLAQTGTWNYLREEITVALESRRSVRFSTGFHFVPELVMADQWANAITFILAKTINLCFSDASNESMDERNNLWQALAAELASWRHGLPITFQPFSTASRPGNVFPSIWLLRPWHGKFIHFKSLNRADLCLIVAAEQYCSVIEILLELSRPCSTETSLRPPAIDRSRETIVQHVLKICGLAYTNDNIPARVNAFGPLAFCGRYLREATHRN
ncbi:hypothetical protein EG329_007309 [Mollisiaceae sp. DMI_Dod_QoI]|nr:hypothetical protein EG329_007309 [Helotiales sp. DMI_Dod_QoI]